jgi:hypothetical protein
MQRRGVGVEVRVSAVLLRIVQVQAAGGAQCPQPEGDEPKSDGKFGPPLPGRWRGDPAPGEKATHEQHGDRMTESPPDAKAKRSSETRPVPDESTDGDHVIHLDSVRCSEDKRGRVGRPK